jgi:DNA-directed RNA polymerase specialized sigma24 family protein/ribosome-associated translation inhibitor RaiA
MTAIDTTQTDTSSTVGDRIVCRDCPSEVEDRVRDAWVVQRLRLTRLLKHLRNPQYQFTLVVVPVPTGYEARLTLALESGTLAARAERESIDGAIGHAADQLEWELTRHLSILRNEKLVRRLRRRRSDLEAIEPVLTADRARADRGAFVEALRPYLPRLRDLARHEILVAELERRILPGDVTVGDLLDELLDRAWDRYESRPKDRSLDSWLVEQLYEVADARLGGHVPESAAERSRTGETAGRGGEDEVWARNPDASWLDESGLRTRDLFGESPGEQGAASSVEPGELYRLVHEALRGAPRTQRRAFVLAAFDGWTEEEIGMLLRRRPEEVRADIEAARARVRERLAVPGEGASA